MAITRAAYNQPQAVSLPHSPPRQILSPSPPSRKFKNSVSAIESAIRTLHQLWQLDQLDYSTREYTLSPAQYDNLQRRIDTNSELRKFVNLNLRISFLAPKHLLLIEMSAAHNSPDELIRRAHREGIENALEHGSPHVRDFIKHIKINGTASFALADIGLGSTDAELTDTEVIDPEWTDAELTHAESIDTESTDIESTDAEPICAESLFDSISKRPSIFQCDMSFQFYPPDAPAGVPTPQFEFRFSQSKKALETKAEGIMVPSQGDCRRLANIYLPYHSYEGKRISQTSYTPNSPFAKYVDTRKLEDLYTCHKEILRTKKGIIIKEDAIVWKLEDYASRKLVQDYGLTDEDKKLPFVVKTRDIANEFDAVLKSQKATKDGVNCRKVKSDSEELEDEKYAKEKEVKEKAEKGKEEKEKKEKEKREKGKREKEKREKEKREGDKKGKGKEKEEQQGLRRSGRLREKK